MAGRRKRRKLVRVTNFPELLLPGPPAPSRVEKATSMSSHPFLTLGISSSGVTLDDADLAILKAKESKERRKKEETRMELEKIQERVQYILNEYQSETPTEDETPNPSDVDLHAVTNPEELYKLLKDVRLRTKYHQQVTVLMFGHEESLEDRERLLQSINEFFQETTAGNTEQLLEEISSEEIDLKEATADLESALRTAQTAGDRLLQIKKDMGQLFALVQAFPDTKKGRKKLEKALLNAQEEVESLQSQLAGMQGEMEAGKGTLKRLQIQLDAKTTECDKLKKNASQVDHLQRVNASLQSELDSTKEALRNALSELERLRTEKLQLMAKKSEVKEVEEVVDEGKVSELESALTKEKEKVQELGANLKAQEAEFQEKMAALVAEHEAEIQEMRSRHEEQMKSLMEDDMFSDGGFVEEEAVMADEEEMPEMKEALVDIGRPEPQEMEDNGLSDVVTVETLRMEFQQREIKLKEEINETKNKSRKTITGLKTQLVEAQNRLRDGRSDLQKEIDTLKAEKSSIEAEREENCQQILSLEENIASLQTQLEEMAAREKESENQVNQLQLELQGALAAKLAGEAAVSHDPAHLSPPPFPIQPMDEVPFSTSGEPSTNLVDHFDGGGGGETPHSVESQFPMGGRTPFSEGSEIPGGVQFFHGSPDELGSSHQFLDHLSATGNPTTAPVPPPQGLHMLIQSRLSHHSPQQQRMTSLSPDHPVVTEWAKAYDLVLKFRDGVADMLREDQRFESEADDICSVEGVPLQKDEEVQGQVTQMRFSLTLMLHQIEVTLQETFGKLLAVRMGGEGEGQEGGVDGDDEMKSLRLTKSRLEDKLRKTENMHHMELQESKDTIANLSNKVEMLRMEVANLRHTMAANEKDRQSKASLSMFTNLDFERNIQELESAVDSDKITAEAYEKMKKEMKEYLSVPVKRLTQVSKRTEQKKLKEKLISEIRREFSDCPDKVESLVEKVKSRDKLQQKAFETMMEGLRVKRTSLAGTLTLQLGEMEQSSKSFLIKPIYGTPSKDRHQDLITPLPRPIPVRRIPQQLRRAHNKPRSRTKSPVQSSYFHLPQNQYMSPKVQTSIITEEQDHARGTGLKHSPSPSHQTYPTTGEWSHWRERRGEEEPVSPGWSPPPPPTPPHLNTHPLLSRDSSRTQQGGGTPWLVEESRPPTRQESLPFSPLMFHTPPSIPGIIDINNTRKRHLMGLMKELRLSSPAAPTPRPHTDQSLAVQSKLVLRNLQDPRSQRQSRASSPSRPRTPSLPPISFPCSFGINGQAISTAF